LWTTQPPREFVGHEPTLLARTSASHSLSHECALAAACSPCHLTSQLTQR